MKSKAAAVLADRIEAAAVAPPKPEAASPGLALVRRILQARDPSALAELDAGLVEAAKGEPALVAWLKRPIAVAAPDDVDPLDALAAALAAATAHANMLPPLHPRAATVIGMVSNIAARLEKVTTGRPRVPTVDEVTERISKVRDEAVKKILEHTTEAREKLAKDRGELVVWARENLGPMIAAELERRLGVMLGDAPPEESRRSEPMIISIVGAPASGKSWLREHLAEVLGLPSFAIDDEREKLTKGPGHGYSFTHDEAAWSALRGRLRGLPMAIVETAGTGSRYPALVAGARVLTIECTATEAARAARLAHRVRTGHFLTLHSPDYVSRLLASDRPAAADHVVDTSRPADVAAALAAARTFLAA